MDLVSTLFEGVALRTSAGRGPCALVGGVQPRAAPRSRPVVARGARGTSQTVYIYIHKYEKAIGGSPCCGGKRPVCGIHRFYNGLSLIFGSDWGPTRGGLGVDLGSIWGSIWGIRGGLLGRLLGWPRWRRWFRWPRWPRHRQTASQPAS